jgi:asparaginyl-tRNA synthetase
MPLMEIPFYQQEFSETVDGIRVANNADLLMPNYREVIGAGARVKSKEALKEKERIFKLPTGYYDAYLESRELPEYQQTAGFGMGVQRFLQYITRMPHIWEVCAFPRGHTIPKP